MLRLQAPLPERYSDASPDELTDRIADGQGHDSATASSSSATTTSATR